MMGFFDADIYNCKARWGWWIYDNLYKTKYRLFQALFMHTYTGTATSIPLPTVSSVGVKRT